MKQQTAGRNPTALPAKFWPRALSFKATLQLWHAFSQQWRWHLGGAT
jgi:hypothetical protein